MDSIFNFCTNNYYSEAATTSRHENNLNLLESTDGVRACLGSVVRNLNVGPAAASSTSSSLSLSSKPLRIFSTNVSSVLFVIFCTLLLTLPSTVAHPITSLDVPNSQIQMDLEVSGQGLEDVAQYQQQQRRDTRVLKRILRSVEQEIAERMTTDTPVFENDDATREKRSEKKSYPRICYFSPIQCIFTSEA